jgi:hypothetical protein
VAFFWEGQVRDFEECGSVLRERGSHAGVRLERAVGELNSVQGALAPCVRKMRGTDRQFFLPCTC